MTYSEALNAIDIRAYQDNIEIRRWKYDCSDALFREKYARAAHFYLLLKELPHARINPRIPALLMLEGQLL